MNGIMSASNPEVVVDHVSGLSRAKEPIFFLSFLLLQTDLFLQVGILDDLVQSRNNSRVQQFKIREMSVPLNQLSEMILNRPPNRPAPLL